MSIPDLDPRAVHGLMKMGGKKKLDALIAMLRENGPARVSELAAAVELREAQSAAQARKHSASSLGLSALEDVCDQILEAKAWTAGHPLAREAAAALERGLRALAAERTRL